MAHTGDPVTGWNLTRARIDQRVFDAVLAVATLTIALASTAQNPTDAQHPTEANALADRIAVMEGGVLQQFGTPSMIKERPANLFTGTFVGEPPMNVFTARVAGDDGRIVLELPEGVTLAYPAGAFTDDVRRTIRAKGDIVIGIRPYSVRRAESGVEATVAVNQWLGDQTHIAADFAGGIIVLVEHDRTVLEPGRTIAVEIDPAALHIFDAATGIALAHGMELA